MYRIAKMLVKIKDLKNTTLFFDFENKIIEAGSIKKLDPTITVLKNEVEKSSENNATRKTYVIKNITIDVILEKVALRIIFKQRKNINTVTKSFNNIVALLVSV